ncbi:peptidylprolyl isomerase [Phnomibacter ginsenosidimutans]|uniref:Peptidyl-prolyl cis-trans isomerase n=2 Tax=Phnomibacter ginsenosidimutans TaxID=2676868 RepID=A0A6I6G4V0_9BACT|nr:peptidylprolyl isomerase [Phnomibacter ginsenosidimutans]
MKFMKKISVVLLMCVAVAATLAGCTKSSTGCQVQDPSKEEAAIQAFIAAKGITATKSSRGLYYQIITPGSTSRPQNTSVIYCTYKGTLLDGTVFDQQTNPGLTGFQLSGLIEAWKIGLPLIGKGGSIKMILPSALGYGCTGSGSSIPPNTPLYFEMTLVDFFN